jgi:Phytochelatin synthase
MTKILVIFLAMTTWLSPLGSASEPSHFLPLPEDLIPLTSPEGRKLLFESKASEAFWELIQFYSNQPDLGSCSVASCTMVLNALPIVRPTSVPHGRFPIFTAENLFTPEVEAIVTRAKVSSSGMTLDQLSRVLATKQIVVETNYASSTSLEKFRETAKTLLNSKGRFIVVNYLRSSLAQESGGHISPLGAYHESADRILIVDTANYKYPWVWVRTGALWKAMSESVDSKSKISRGYIVLSSKPTD